MKAKALIYLTPDEEGFILETHDSRMTFYSMSKLRNFCDKQNLDARFAK